MIRFAKTEDIPDIMGFIDSHWKKGHILAVSMEHVLFQHQYGHEISYIVSVDENAAINGILGYIPYGENNRDVMTAMWKVIHTEDPMLGMRLLQFLMQQGDVRIMACPGINAGTIGIYRYLGYQTGEMNHWYRLRPGADYQIASILDSSIHGHVLEQGRFYLERYKQFGQLEESFSFETYTKERFKPFKEKAYICRRYFEHPTYLYEVYGVTDGTSKAELLLIFRREPYHSSIALRLVDCIGKYDLLEYVTSSIDDLLVETDAEYVDLYEAGLSSTLLLRAGWRNVQDGTNIIPNYFSPFVRENISIYYFSTEPNIVLFKGDGDQDRPN